MPKPAESFAKMPTKHLQCRALTHPWEPKYAYPDRVDRYKAIVVFLECGRCPSTKELVFFPTQHKRKSRGIKYPDNYLVKGLDSWGGRKVINENVLLEMISRIPMRTKPNGTR